MKGPLYYLVFWVVATLAFEMVLQVGLAQATLYGFVTSYVAWAMEYLRK